jgi:4-hydroxybenzoate polyprenyltransferase
VRRTLYAFFAFCLGSSAVYLVNDVSTSSPTGGTRRSATGRSRRARCRSRRLGRGARLLRRIALPRRARRRPPFAVTWVVAAYMSLNLAYSLQPQARRARRRLLHRGGFLLRVYAGGLAAGAFVSHWLMLCTLFLSLFLALCKRRAETDLLGEGRGEHRAILLEYTAPFLDQMVTVLAACTILTYTMYTVSDETARKFGARTA